MKWLHHYCQWVCSALVAICSVLYAQVSHAAFGLTSTIEFFTVDTGAGLVFSVRRLDNGVGTQSAGDISSLKYNGVEYQNQSRGSQLNSGFDFLYDLAPESRIP